VAVRKLIVTQFVSLDGVVQAPGHPREDLEGGFEHGGWIGPQMAEHGRYNHDFFQTVGAFLLGRVTYEIFAGYWPTLTDPGDQIARALNTLPKYVASTGLSAPEWAGTTVIAGDVPGEVARLKQQPGKPILVVGSGNLTQTLMRHDLVDEYQLWLHPIVLGTGKRLFPEGSPTASMRFVESTTTGSGLVILTYARAGGPARAELASSTP
jgi:dihydrofolate reductase